MLILEWLMTTTWENKMNVNTGMVDDNNKEIFVGDILLSEWGYKLLVCQEGQEYFGKLLFDGKTIVDSTHSCANIPYSLNNGHGHTIDTVRQ